MVHDYNFTFGDWRHLKTELRSGGVTASVPQRFCCKRFLTIVRLHVILYKQRNNNYNIYFQRILRKTEIMVTALTMGSRFIRKLQGYYLASFFLIENFRDLPQTMTFLFLLIPIKFIINIMLL